MWKNTRDNQMKDVDDTTDDSPKFVTLKKTIAK